MSANLDLVRSIYAAQARGDFSSADWASPGIELVFADGPSPGTSVGLTAMARMWRELLSSGDDIRIEAERYRELNDETVLVLTQSRVRAKRSRVELPGPWTNGAATYLIRDGEVVRVVVYLDRDRAFADLGLTTEGEKP